MRRRFAGFSSAVDLAEIDTVALRNMASGDVEVVITTRGSNEITRTFIARPADATHRLQMYAEATKCVDHVEFIRRWGLLFEKIGPHALTWLMSVLTSLGIINWLKDRF